MAISCRCHVLNVSRGSCLICHLENITVQKGGLAVVWCRCALHRLSESSPALASRWIAACASPALFSSGPLWRGNDGGRRKYCRQIEQVEAQRIFARRQDGLVCNVTHPGIEETSGVASDASESGDREFAFAREGKKRPVVVMLGWTHCKDKDLAKFSAMYEKSSCITLRCTIPGQYVAYQSNRLLDASQQVLQLIKEKGFNEHPIFFVLFSNGGAIFYQQISLALQKVGCPLKVKGVIFDSCPGDRRVLSTYKTSRLIFSSHPLNLPISLMYTLIFSSCGLIERISEIIGIPNVVSTDPMRLVTEPFSWPQMFLYSSADMFIDSNDVERFASERAKRGVRSQLVLFTGTPHLKHRSTYQDVYASTVFRFMNECLAETADENAKKVREKDDRAYPTKRVVLPQEASSQVRQVHEELTT